MFGNKSEIKLLNDEIRDLERRVKRLECKHKEFEFTSSQTFMGTEYIKKCVRCNKTIEEYLNKEDYFKAQAEDLRDKAEFFDKIIKEEKIEADSDAIINKLIEKLQSGDKKLISVLMEILK